MNPLFSYEEAFSRNLGWFTEAEQQALRGKTVAIAGMGGVGGVHLLTLARLGVANFKIADMDVFENANFNRQVGAMVSTIGKSKVGVLAGMAKDINPEAKVTEFGKGVNEANLDEFLKGADLFIDGFDFFVIDIRCKTYKRCRELGIPAFVAAPVGMGVAFMAFTKDSMSFEEYFRLDGQSDLRQYINFLIGLSPSGMHGGYLVEPHRLNVAAHKTPSTIVGTQLCASYTAAQAVKELLGRGEVKRAPFHYHFDAYLNKFDTVIAPGNGSDGMKRKGDDIERAFREKMDGAPKREPAASH